MKRKVLTFFYNIVYINNVTGICRNGGMVDAADSKSAGSNTVWVQVPFPVPY